MAALFTAKPRGRDEPADGIGSVLLLPEVLGKPLRDGRTDEVQALAALLARLDLHPLDRATAELATALCRSHRLRAADATHRHRHRRRRRPVHHQQPRDFPNTITEVEVTYPDQLPEPD